MDDHGEFRIEDSCKGHEGTFATENGKIHLYDFFGEKSVNWPVRMTPKILTAPVVFFHPLKNSTFICAGSSSGELNIWNSEGFLLETSPISIDDSIKRNLSVKDINNDSIPEIIFSSDKGRIYALNIDGTSLPGFPVQLEYEMESSINLIDIGNDNNYEIVCSPKTPAGDILLINNTGTIWEEKRLTTGSLNFSDPVVSKSVINIQSIFLITEDGNLFKWDQNMNLENNFPVKLPDKFLNSPTIKDINNDNKDEIICISADGTLYLISDTGEIISQINLDIRPVENEKIVIFDVNKDGEKEIIISCTDNFLRFYNKDGALQFKIKGVTSPFIKDMDSDNKNEILTATDDGNVYLYKIQ